MISPFEDHANIIVHICLRLSQRLYLIYFYFYGVETLPIRSKINRMLLPVDTSTYLLMFDRKPDLKFYHMH
jgi:hypothetical protein